MVYKKFHFRDGKKYGPYYYESYRDDGKVKRRYLGTEDPKKEKKKFLPTKPKKLIAIFTLILLIFGIYFIGFNNTISGFVVSQAAGEEQILKSFDKDLDLEIKEPPKIADSPVSNNKNKRMDFAIEGGLRLYFDLLNYSEFVENTGEVLTEEGLLGEIELELDEEIDEEPEEVIELDEELDQEEVEEIEESEIKEKSNETINKTIEEGSNESNETEETDTNINETESENVDDNQSEDDEIEVVDTELIEPSITGDSVNEDGENSESENSKSENSEGESEETEEQLKESESEELDEETAEGETESEIDENSQESESIEEPEAVESNPVESSESSPEPAPITGNVVRFFSFLTGNAIANQETNLSVNEIKNNLDSLDSNKIEEIADQSVIELSENEFDVEINETAAELANVDYKWAYKVELKDLNFLAKVQLTSNNDIRVLDETSLVIGSHIVSFKDLVEEGYIVKIEVPELDLEEPEEPIIDEKIVETNTNETDINQTKDIIEDNNLINETEIVNTEDNLNESELEVNTEDTKTEITNESLIEANQTIVEQPEIVNNNESFEPALITGAVIGLFNTASNLIGEVEDLEYENKISIYLERDFTNTNYGVGDTIYLDPVIIEITNANHLDENRNFIADIYDYVKSLDDIWVTIPENHYVRVTFEQNLTNENDITIYARGNGSIKVYEEDGGELIAEFDNINDDEYNKVLLTNLIGSQDTFDLLILGSSFSFDHIIDPKITISNFSESSSFLINTTSEINFSHLEISNSSPYYIESGYGLVLYYPFDENTSSTVFDYTGNNWDGTVNGNLFFNTTCLYASCYTGNGSALNITAPDITSTKLYNISVFAWVKGISGNGAQKNLVSQWDVSNSERSWKLGTGLSSDSKFVAMVSGDGLINGNNSKRYSSSITVFDNESWHHIGFVFGSNDTFKLYVDGVEDTSPTIHNNDSIHGIFDSSAEITILDFINGSIDEVMVFNLSLTDSEILEIYQNQSHRYKSPGTQTLKQFNITLAPGNTTFNISTNSFWENFSSSLEIRLGEWNITMGYNDSVDGDISPANGEGLVLYYHFDNRSIGENDTHVYDYSGNENNGTWNGSLTGVFGFNSSQAIFNGSFSFDGKDDYVEIDGTNNLNFTDELTISAWVYKVGNNTNSTFTNGTSQTIIGRFNGFSGHNHNSLRLLSDGRINAIFQNGSNTLNANGSVITDNKWYFLAFTLNSSHSTVYLDGNVDFTTTSINLAWGNNASKWRVGNENRTDWFFNGSIDEVMMFNRSLNSLEVKDLYVKGRANWSYLDYQNVSYNVGGNEFILTPNTTNVLPEYKFIPGNATNPFYSPILGADLLFDFFTDDSDNPEINITFPFTNNSNQSSRNLDINYTFSDAFIETCWYSNDTYSINRSIPCGTNLTNITWSEGLHNLTIYLNDTNNNFNFSTISFTIDKVPQITIQQPINNTNSSNSGLDVNFTFFDDNDIETCWYSNDTYSINRSIPCNLNITNITWSEALHNLTVYINDTNNNLNFSTVSFRIGIAPDINFTDITPANNTLTSNSSVQLNVSIENAGSLSEVIWNWNGTNYTLFNSSIILFMNLDNVSDLGENETNNVTVDLSIYGNNGTCHNMSTSGVGPCNWNASGKYGSAISFDGNNDYIDISWFPDDPNVFTFLAWTKRNGENSDGTGGMIFGHRNDIINLIQLHYNANGSMVSLDYRGSSNSLQTIQVIDDFSDWHHLAFVFNSSGDYRLYNNGILIGSRTDDFSSDSFSVNFTSLGSAGRQGNNNSKTFLNGSIDEVIIVNRSLTSQEIYQFYASNLRKYNKDNWSLYVNQSKNASEGLINSTYTYLASVKDLAGNHNQTRTRVLNGGTDSTPPTATFSCSPNPVTAGSTTTCDCNPSDVGSGINSSATVFTVNPDTSNTGSFIQSCSFADIAGNTGTETTTLVVESSGGGGGGGGGSGNNETNTTEECPSDPFLCSDIGDQNISIGYAVCSVNQTCICCILNEEERDCGDWGDCMLNYSLESINESFEEQPFIIGYQTRICEDIVETRDCQVEISVIEEDGIIGIFETGGQKIANLMFEDGKLNIDIFFQEDIIEKKKDKIFVWLWPFIWLGTIAVGFTFHLLYLIYKKIRRKIKNKI